jgi:hypothetical protein
LRGGQTVPSLLHEVLVELFRERPALACELLAACAGIELSGRAESGSVDLSLVASPEYRADRVVVMRDAKGVATAAIVVEIQLWFDPAKRRTWPVYVTSLRAIHKCPTTLLVIAPNAGVAKWARAPIEIGHPGFCLRPVVVGYADVPRVTDEEAARAAPELAVLSVLAHPEVSVARAAIEAVRPLAAGTARLYLDLVMTALPDAARHVVEAAMIEGYKYQSEFARKYFAQGLEEGREEGCRAALLELAREKAGGLSGEDEARLSAVRDANELTRLLLAFGRARDQVEVRAILDALA